MNENIKLWLTDLYEWEIEEINENIRNQHIWELGYDGEDPNPHTEHIENLKAYIEVLENLKEELK